jgi:hypothetical protein
MRQRSTRQRARNDRQLNTAIPTSTSHLTRRAGLPFGGQVEQTSLPIRID